MRSGSVPSGTGHSSAAVTEISAEIDATKAADVIEDEDSVREAKPTLRRSAKFSTCRFIELQLTSSPAPEPPQ